MWRMREAQTSGADPGRVWRVLADVAGWSGWNDGVEAISLDGPVAVGTRFVMTLPDHTTVSSEIVELVPGVLLTDRTPVESVTIDVVHRVTPVGSGCEVAFEASVYGEAPDAVLAEVGAAVTGDFPEVVAALIARAEGTGR